MFLGYGGDKEFDVKSYVDASLTPIRIALSRDTGLLGNVAENKNFPTRFTKII